MDACLITFRSVTPAQRAELLLRREGIAAVLQRTPRILAERGCGYSVRIGDSYRLQAAEILRQRGIHFQKIYWMRDGIPEEVLL